MSVGTNLLRYFLLSLNTIFIIFAGGLFGAAIWSELFYRNYFDVVDGQPVLVFLFSSSCFIFIISLLGWSGAYKHHLGLLKFYLSFCIIVFATQLLLSIFSLAYTTQILPYFTNAMYTALNAISPPISEGFDFMQAELYCCGVENSTDWMNSTIWVNQTMETITENNLTSPYPDALVPNSCCIDTKNSSFCGIEFNSPDNIYQAGCALTLKTDIEQHVNVFAIVLAVICVLQLTSILFAGCLVHNKEHEPEEEQSLVQNEQIPESS